jgi:hypothetical protein
MPAAGNPGAGIFEQAFLRRHFGVAFWAGHFGAGIFQLKLSIR